MNEGYEGNTADNLFPHSRWFGHCLHGVVTQRRKIKAVQSHDALVMWLNALLTVLTKNSGARFTNTGNAVTAVLAWPLSVPTWATVDRLAELGVALCRFGSPNVSLRCGPEVIC